MSADSASPLPVRLQGTLQNAWALFRAIQARLAPGWPSTLSNSDSEITIGMMMRLLTHDLESLVDANLPVQTRIGVRSPRSLADSLIVRWQWNRIIGADGDAFLAECSELWAIRQKDYLAAALSYVDAYAAGEISERPDDGYFQLARDAEKAGIPPCSPSILTKQELERLHKVWLFSPCLGPGFPTRTSEELEIFSAALRDIEDGLRGSNLELSESHMAAQAQSAETAGDAFRRLDPFNTIMIAEGHPLECRAMPRAMTFMRNLSGSREPVELWNCQGWGTGGLHDIVSIPNGRWAVGTWDEQRTARYGSHPAGDLPLREVTAEGVIALCDQRGVILPSPLVSELAVRPGGPAKNAKPVSSQPMQMDASDVGGAQRPREIVLLIHGINTFAYWQPMVQKVLQEIPNLEVRVPSYGYFDVLRFWCPFYTRQQAIDEVLLEVQKAQNSLRGDAGSRLSVIAHSHGTYVITQILNQHLNVHLHRLILCGSIVRRRFRWDAVSARIGTPVINDYGTRDVWPVLAKCLTWGFGDTGRHKFGKAEVCDRAMTLRTVIFLRANLSRGRISYEGFGSRGLKLESGFGPIGMKKPRHLCGSAFYRFCRCSGSDWASSAGCHWACFTRCGALRT